MVAPFNKTNTFNLETNRCWTQEAGDLVPNLIQEVMPGDTFDLYTDLFCRAEAMIAPAFVDYDIIQEYYWWPCRCAMPKYWEDYITGGKDGNNSTVWPHIKAPANGYDAGSLADFLELPCNEKADVANNIPARTVGNYEFSAYTARMYNEIYNWWYRDENLINEITWSDQPGLDTTTPMNILKRCWKKDRFTNALPDTQRGPVASFSLADDAPVVGNGKTLGLTDGTTNGGFYFDSSNNATSRQNLYGTNVGSTGSGAAITSGSIGITTDPAKSGLVAKMNAVTPVNWLQVRLTGQIQNYLELNMRAGYRLTEWTPAHFGVKIPDERIQRPVYLGGFKAPLMITPVEQTSESGSTPQGNLAGRGQVGCRSKKIRRSFVEYGFIMGICSIIPKASYSQGLAPMYFRETRYDFPLPIFSHIGDQAIKNKELFCQDPSVVDANTGEIVNEQTFGYTDRYNEMRHGKSTVHGLFRPKESLDYWTLTREFDSVPVLGQTFVECNPSTRIFAVQNIDHFVCQARHHITALRPLPKFGKPGLVDHI